MFSRNGSVALWSFQLRMAVLLLYDVLDDFSLVYICCSVSCMYASGMRVCMYVCICVSVCLSLSVSLSVFLSVSVCVVSFHGIHIIPFMLLCRYH